MPLTGTPTNTRLSNLLQDHPEADQEPEETLPGEEIEQRELVGRHLLPSMLIVHLSSESIRSSKLACAAGCIGL